MAVQIYNTVKKADGLAQDDFEVAIELTWDTTDWPVAKSDADDSMIKGTVTTSTNDEGYWSVDIVSNDFISPAGSLYKITETEVGTSLSEVYYVNVTDQPEAWVGDLLAATPSWEEE